MMNKRFGLDSNTRWLVGTFTFFGTIYGIISLVNHYYFRTSALDLGLYTNAMYDYIHFQWNDSLTIRKIPENLLADHFDLYLLIFSPLSLIFGTYTLLIVQIVSILLGGLGVYQYFKKTDEKLALHALVFFLSFFAIYSALAFDYHSNVVAAMFVPWFLLKFKEEKYKQAFLFLVLVVIAKENLALWTAFICLALIFDYFRNKTALKYLIAFFAFSVIYYLAVIEFVMPAISNSGVYPHFHFSALGENTFDAIQQIVLHPFDSFRLLFVNHIGDPAGDFVKLEFHLTVLFSGGLLLFLKPNYLLMLIPIYFQKLFHDFPTMWSIRDHYSIEFAPIVAIGAFIVILKIKNKKKRIMLSLLLILLAAIATIRVMDNTIIYTNKSSIKFYNASHYQKNYDVKLVYEKLKTIPPDAPVSVQTNFLPHLALRDHAYQFPLIHNAQFIILAPSEISYPLEQEEYNLKVREIRESPEWETLFESKDIFILRRVSIK